MEWAVSRVIPSPSIPGTAPLHLRSHSNYQGHRFTLSELTLLADELHDHTLSNADVGIDLRCGKSMNENGRGDVEDTDVPIAGSEPWGPGL